MAKPAAPEKPSFKARLKQIGMVVSFTARHDRRFVPLVVLVMAVPLLAGILTAVLGAGPIWLPIGFMAALLGGMVVLNTRSQRAMINEAEGKPGAAASIIESMRGNWRVHAAIATTTQFDVVHLVIGKSGVLLVGEGNAQRIRQLISQERRRLVKVIGNADLRDMMVGHEEGQVPLGKLRVTLMKLPNSLTAKEINALDVRLTALSARPQLPKGAIPKNMRPSKGAFRATRGR